MEAKAENKVLLEEAMSPELIAELKESHAKIDALRDEAIAIDARQKHLMQEAKYLKSKKWLSVDKAHPASMPGRFEQNVERRYDFETGKVYVTERFEPDNESNLNDLKGILSTLSSAYKVILSREKDESPAGEEEAKTAEKEAQAQV